MSEQAPQLNLEEATSNLRMRLVGSTLAAVTAFGGLVAMEGAADAAPVQAQQANEAIMHTMPNAAPRMSPALRERWQHIDIAAHRGDTVGLDRGRHTENTYGAFKSAVRVALAEHRRTGRPLSSFFLETDLWETKDGVLVDIHNKTINATTNGKGSVGSMTYAKLERYHTDLTPVHEKVPAFKKILRFAARKGVSITPEIKDPHASRTQLNKLHQLITKYDMQSRTIVQSFYKRDLRLWHKAAPEVASSYLRNSHIRPNAVKAVGAEWVSYKQGAASAAVISHAHAAGLKVSIWTPDNAHDLNKDVELGADLVITNMSLEAARIASGKG